MNWRKVEHFTLADAQDFRPSRANARHSGLNREGAAWLGVSSKVEVERLAREGWPEGLARMRAALGEIEAPRAASFRRDRLKGDYGDSLDMQEVYRGNLGKAWTRRTRRPVEGTGTGVTRILVNFSTGGQRKQQEYFWRGAAAVLMADALETAGRPVEILAVATHKQAYVDEHIDDYTCQTVTLKGAGEHLDPEALATVLGLVGWYRHFAWGVRARDPRKVRDNFGSPVYGMYPADVRQEGDIVIEQVWTLEEARATVTRELEQISNPNGRQMPAGV